MDVQSKIKLQYMIDTAETTSIRDQIDAIVSIIADSIEFNQAKSILAEIYKSLWNDENETIRLELIKHYGGSDAENRMIEQMHRDSIIDDKIRQIKENSK